LEGLDASMAFRREIKVTLPKIEDLSITHGFDPCDGQNRPSQAPNAVSSAIARSDVPSRARIPGRRSARARFHQLRSKQAILQSSIWTILSIEVMRRDILILIRMLMKCWLIYEIIKYVTISNLMVGKISSTSFDRENGW
jgi:hypothetical protein